MLLRLSRTNPPVEGESRTRPVEGLAGHITAPLAPPIRATLLMQRRSIAACAKKRTSSPPPNPVALEPIV
jgi:hypothetical protein